MSETNSTPSRRTVAKGLAWSTPTMAAVVAAPAMAVSPSQTLAYRFRGSVRFDHTSGLACGTSGGVRVASMALNNQTPVSNSPLGFSIVQMPRTDGSGLSPKTTATLPEPVQFVVGYPAGMVSTTTPLFTFTDGTGANWSAPTAKRGVSTIYGSYDMFTFTWLGSRTQSTVPDVTTTTGSRPASWAGTALSGSWRVNPNYCGPKESWCFANYYSNGKAAGLGTAEPNFGTFTTANGFTGNVRSVAPSTGGWIRILVV